MNGSPHPLDEDLVDVFRRCFSIRSEVEINFLVGRVDEEVIEPVLVDRTVCLDDIGHAFRKQTSLLVTYNLASSG